jgi:hypothetical protein
MTPQIGAAIEFFASGANEPIVTRFGFKVGYKKMFADPKIPYTRVELLGLAGRLVKNELQELSAKIKSVSRNVFTAIKLLAEQLWSRGIK